jgi:hypothetical protein
MWFVATTATLLLGCKGVVSVILIWPGTYIGVMLRLDETWRVLVRSESTTKRHLASFDLALFRDIG